MIQRLSILATLALTVAAGSAQAQTNYVKVAAEADLKSLDPIWTTAAITAGHAFLVYDQLFAQDLKGISKPQMVETYTVSPDGLKYTFTLRQGLRFHDGTPVTAKDVKWSFDRAVTVGGFPTFQMAAGSLEKPEQFTAVDDYTFRVDGERVAIEVRPRGSPVDKLVAELMIHVNATWGRMLAEAGVPGLYRNQRGAKTRMEADPGALLEPAFGEFEAFRGQQQELAIAFQNAAAERSGEPVTE